MSRLLLVFVVIVSCLGWAQGGIFFILSSVNITLLRAFDVPSPLPPLVELSVLRDVPVFLSQKDPSVVPQFTLLESDKNDLFYIKGHELHIHEKFFDPAFTLDKSTEFFPLTIEAYMEGEGRANMSVNILVSNQQMSCELQSYAICFWSAEKLQVVDELNADEPILAAISSPLIAALCPHFSVTYSITPNTNLKVVRLKNGIGPWALEVEGGIDREKTNVIKAKLSCTVSGGIEKTYQNEVTVLVKDMDDHLPYFVDAKPSDSLNMEHISKGDTIAVLEVKDKDSPAVNNISVHVIDPPWKMSVRETEKPEENNKETHLQFEIISEIDLENVGDTIINFEITDENRMPGFGIKTINREIQLNGSKPKALSIIDLQLYDSSVRLVDVIRSHNGDVSYLRVLDPRIRISADWNFTITSKDFHITNDGILYLEVKKADFKKYHLNLTQDVEVFWTNHHSNGSQLVHINANHMLWPKNHSCVRRDFWCPTIRNKEKCEESCGNGGVATETQGCIWHLADVKKKDSHPEKYYACTNNRQKCPDGVCDGFERLHAGICPFDCADLTIGGSYLNILGADNGVCFWDPDTTNRVCWEGTDTENVFYEREPVDCDLSCQAMFVGFGVAMLVAIVVIVKFCRNYRKLQKRCPSRPMKGELFSMTYEESFRPLSEPHSPVKPEYYDSKWEFPRHRLTIEETVGEGEFGMVLKARADGIQGHTETLTVAIKTLKNGAKDAELGDLVSELELLKDVDHPNVIKLLGACTIEDGPLYVIIEYAEYGSLRNYLKKHRQSNNDIGKESNLYLDNLTPLTSTHILTFAWQIAKGMAYLTEMKLVHRDLAARNVLLTKDLLCKISDFGLTRDIYEDDTYLKRSKGRVPIKWMALESLADHVYTSKSDVWSYGVLLWELATKGSSPYPGVPPQNLFNLLQDGYRMERPPGCSPELYGIMRDCWSKNPSQRPSFVSLVAQFDAMLAAGREYLDLGPAAVENRQYMEEEPDFKWQFQGYDHPRPPCGCPPENCAHIRRPCSCPPGLCIHPKYANEVKNVHNDLWDANVDDLSKKSDISNVQKLTYVA